jgi:chondroitin AC lyase
MKNALPACILVIILFTVSAFTTQAQSKVSYPTDLAQLHQNMLDDLLGSSRESDSPQPLMDQLKEDGSWPGIEYTSQQRGSWQPTQHLNNVMAMARAWNKIGSTYYHDPKLLQSIHKALNYWLDNDFQCPNWWYPQIGVPQIMAPILILMEGELSREQMAKGYIILDRSKIGQTGQNKVWQSANVMLKSLLQRDSEMVGKAAKSIQEELKVAPGEGIQSDGSFHQHGPQIQFGNYGLAYVGDMIKWIRLLRGTPFAFDESKMTILRNYLIDGQQWITWKNQMDISACGRQLFVDAQESKARSLARAFNNMETLDPANTGVYKKAGDYKTLEGNKHFWRSDFQVQRTNDYYFSVKMCSERVIGAESCNSENIRGYYMGDGASYLYQSGVEYENIFPYWDWKKIPGTTIQQDEKELPVLTASGYRIATNFVGGVSDGKSGIAVLDYDRNGLTAKKAWFIFNDQVVCLGAGITSAAGVPVTTSVNQSFLKGEVLAKTKETITIQPESGEALQPKWILHDHAGYFFPEGANLKLETKTVTGSWNKVASMYKDEPITAPIFKLWIEHGIVPTDQTYAYCLVPKATKQKMEQMAAKPTFRILKNDKKMQEVISANQQWSGMVFYLPGKSAQPDGIEVDQPCVVMQQKNGKERSLSLSDPTQKRKQLTLRLSGNYQTTTVRTKTNFDQGKTTFTIDLPSSPEAGKTVLLKLSKSK